MGIFLVIISWMAFVVLVMWRALVSYFYWKDLKSGAISVDGIFFPLLQGIIFTGVAIFLLTTSENKSFNLLLPGIVFGIAGVFCLYFGFKSLVYIKKHKR